MESSCARACIFAGEVLDVDAYTGDLICKLRFSTGRLAGKCAALDKWQESGKKNRMWIKENEKQMIAVAIDGPAGAGKSTVARSARKKVRVYLCRYGSAVPRGGPVYAGAWGGYRLPGGYCRGGSRRRDHGGNRFYGGLPARPAFAAGM